MAELCIERLDVALGGLADKHILVLGISYREDVKELAFSTATRIVELLHRRGTKVLVHDALFEPSERAGFESEVAQLDSATPLQAAGVIVHAFHRQHPDLDCARLRGLERR